MRIGFIGCGGFSSGNHIPNAARNPNFDIVAFCDLGEEQLKNLADRYNPEYVTTDYKKVMSDSSIELIICGTKPDFRLPIMEEAVANGKHLFVEKPMCYREEDIAPMISLMSKSSGKFMVGFNRPYSPLMQELKPLYNQYKDGNTTIIYRIIGESQLWPEHHYNSIVNEKESTIIHEITHIFDLLNWLTGLEPVRVYTAGEGNLDNVITLNYPDHVTAVIIAGDNGSAAYPKERLEINTNHGVILGDNFTELTCVGFDNVNIRKTFEYKMAGEVQRLNGREAAEQLREWRQSVTEQEQACGYYYDRMPKVEKGHYNELEIFRQLIESNQPSQTDVFAGAIANLLAWKAIESWEKKVPVELDFSNLRKI